MARTASKQNIQLPAASEFLKALDTAAENCNDLLQVKGPTAKIIPMGVRNNMRVLIRVQQFWAKNRAAYTALVEAAQSAGGNGKTQSARA